MRTPTRAGFIVAGVVAAASVTAAAVLFTEDFSGMPTGACIADDATVGAWTFVYNGYGCNAFIDVDADTVLMEQPAAATASHETHGSLVLGPYTSGDLVVQLSTPQRSSNRCSPSRTSKPTCCCTVSRPTARCP
jgi:hypothetical protein